MKEHKIGEKVWFEFGDDSILGYTVTNIRESRQLFLDNPKQMIADLECDDKDYGTSACCLQELDDSLSPNDERVIRYEQERKKQTKARLEDVVEWLTLNAELYGSFNGGKLNEMVVNLHNYFEQ